MACADLACEYSAASSRGVPREICDSSRKIWKHCLNSGHFDIISVECFSSNCGRFSWGTDRQHCHEAAVLYQVFVFKWGCRRPTSPKFVGPNLGFQGSNQLILVMKVALHQGSRGSLKSLILLYVFLRP